MACLTHGLLVQDLLARCPAGSMPLCLDDLLARVIGSQSHQVSEPSAHRASDPAGEMYTRASSIAL